MPIKQLRGLVIAFLSALIITFVIFIFAPFLPIDIFQGAIGFIFFIIVMMIAYLVYLVLPPESSEIIDSPHMPENLQEVEETH
ncbi:MAG: hypothetical protein ACFFDT_24520 [Candidatus Hodarchaeota archaeon]